jgi:hypothetical protein
MLESSGRGCCDEDDPLQVRQLPLHRFPEWRLVRFLTGSFCREGYLHLASPPGAIAVTSSSNNKAAASAAPSEPDHHDMFPIVSKMNLTLKARLQ